MKLRATLLATLAMSALILAVGASATPASQLSKSFLDCQEAIAKQATKFVGGLLTLEQRCRDAELAAPGSCAAPDPIAVARLRAKLRAGITKQCDGSPGNLVFGGLAVFGFPGACVDADPGDGFTVEDLNDCIESSHTTGVAAIGAVVALDPTVIGPLTPADLTCQRAVETSGIRFANRLLARVQKCRNAVLRGTIVVVPPRNCATADPETARTIATLEQRVRAKIAARCTDDRVIVLRLCEPNQVTVEDAADCIIAAIRRLIDDPVVADPSDLIDYEYAEPPVCGDNRRNQISEECDGTSDALCSGQCGAPDGFFACLCQNVPRLRVVEHANADLDLGWTGKDHDQHVAEGGGYVTDLWDCDAVTDFDCNVGPTCSLPPNMPCGSSFGAPYTVGDATCASLGQGACRKTRGGSTGPHCNIDFQQECSSNAQCPMVGDRCVKIPHGPPLPVSAGGISVCLENFFTEDIVGTTNLGTGASAVRLRQQSITHLGSINQPCPVCGGFCAGTLGLGNTLGQRSSCTNDSQCPGSSCVTAAICSFGPNADKPCRPDPPFGGQTDFFGNPSVDCPPNIADIGQLDFLFDPTTTGTSLLTANVPCSELGKACFQGANDGRPCTSDPECPGGACHDQCFCPTSSSYPPARPNACNAACVIPGGVSPDRAPCVDDGDCPGGFCHAADCRVNPLDTDSVQEGICSAGPTFQHCSVSTFRPCASDADCGPPETCQIDAARQCFVNGQIVRQGHPGVPDRVSASTFCIPPTTDSGVNVTAGLPAPGAITQPETTMIVGF